MTRHTAPQPDRPASLARRALPAVVLLGASGGFLAALDHPAAPGTLDIAEVDGAGATSEAAASASTSTASPATTATTAVTAPPSTTARATTTPTTTARATTTTTPTTSVPATPTCTGETRTGPAVNTRWGPVQVEAVVAPDGTLCSVDAVAAPDGDSRSASISARAVPVLNARAEADGVAFDAVSGATYTSEAYRDSLQALLDG